MKIKFEIEIYNNLIIYIIICALLLLLIERILNIKCTWFNLKKIIQNSKIENSGAFYYMWSSYVEFHNFLIENKVFSARQIQPFINYISLVILKFLIFEPTFSKPFTEHNERATTNSKLALTKNLQFKDKRGQSN